MDLINTTQSMRLLQLLGLVSLNPFISFTSENLRSIGYAFSFQIQEQLILFFICAIGHQITEE
jgi:hypothetical protein